METTPSIRLKEFGNWSEQTSSSGKRYYYNRSTNVSQWDKPNEWKQAEKPRSIDGLKAKKSGSPDSTNALTPTTKEQSDKCISKDSLPIDSSSTELIPRDSLIGTTVNMTKPRPLNTIYTKMPLVLTSATPIPSMKIISHHSTTSNGRTELTAISKTPNKSMTISEKPSKTETGFQEGKYQKYWRPEMASVKSTLGTESFAFELKKCTDRGGKQLATMFALDRDIHSIRTLDRTALLRTKLLRQRLTTVTQRIRELDSRTQ